VESEPIEKTVYEEYDNSTNTSDSLNVLVEVS